MNNRSADDMIRFKMNRQCKEEDSSLHCVSFGMTVDSNIKMVEAKSHTGRRTFATRLILQGVPVHLVRAQTGHRTLSSFEAYIKLRELQTDQALQDLNVFV